jgi:hypothetical protein
MFQFFGVLVVGCMVQGTECDLQCAGSMGVGLPVQGSVFLVLSVYPVCASGCRLQGAGCRVQVSVCSVQAVWVCISPFMHQS